MAVIVEVPGAGGLRPARSRQPDSGGGFHKMPFAVVVIELRGRGWRSRLGRNAARDEDIVRAIAVVIENGDPVAGAFEDRLLAVFASVDVRAIDTQLRGTVDKLDRLNGAERQQ